MALRPTDNLEAYDLYLRGRSMERRGAGARGPQPLTEAVVLYERAIELDPEFADAWSRLAIARFELSGLYGYQEEMPRGKRALDRVLEIAPDAALSRVAEGYYHYRETLDLARAAERFEAAERLQPGDAEISLAAGLALRGQGRWQRAAEKLQRAAELDPRNGYALLELGQTLGLMGRTEEARAHLERAKSVDPLDPALNGRFLHYLFLEGDTARARAVLSEALGRGTLMELNRRRLEYELAWFARDYPRVIALHPPPGRYHYFRDRLRYAGGDPWLRWALARERTGLAPLAAQYLDSLHTEIDATQAAITVRTDRLAESHPTLASVIRRNPFAEARIHADRAVVWALLGQTDDAIREGRSAVDQTSFAARIRPGYEEELAAIYTHLGLRDEAVEQLERLLAAPSYLTVSSLRLDPTWDSLRDHPRFQALLEGEQ